MARALHRFWLLGASVSRLRFTTVLATVGIVHVVVGGPAPVPLPVHPSAGAIASMASHAIVLGLAAAAAARIVPMTASASPSLPTPSRDDVVHHVVFLARESQMPARGGGGGGNRQKEPIRRAEAVGADRETLRAVRTVPSAGDDETPAPLPQILLDARPLSSGILDHLGLPAGGVSFGTSTGPGSGGGVGSGIGTGIGSGRGPGLGAGSGGGAGGGLYRPGGLVTPPRVLKEVKPWYTARALLDRIQGTVVLAFVVRANGEPVDIRVVRSLDPGGLDDQAIEAVSQWRFEPGRLAGRPVDVVVTVLLDFTMR